MARNEYQDPPTCRVCTGKLDKECNSTDLCEICASAWYMLWSLGPSHLRPADADILKVHEFLINEQDFELREFLEAYGRRLATVGA